MAIESNIIVYNPGKDPLVNFNFMLRVELAIDIACKSVRAFQRELEFDQIQEGGLNDYVHMRRKPISKPFTLEIERYVGTDYVDPLPLGADLILPVLLFVSRNPAQFIPGVTARTYVFHGCTVIKKTYGELSAEQPGILTETITIAYREMLCVDLPWSSVADNAFAPDPAQAHSAKTQSTEPSQLKILGQNLYTEAEGKKTSADKEFENASVTELLGKLRDLEGRIKDAQTGFLAQAEANAKNALDGINTKENKPLFDIVNDLKADVLEKKRILREAEKKLRKMEEAERRAQSDKERKQKEATEKLLNYKEQKKRAEIEISELKNILNDKEQDLEGAKKARDSAKAELKKAQEALRDAEKARAAEKETLKNALQLAESIRKSVESALERAKSDHQKKGEEYERALEEALQADQQVEVAKIELEKTIMTLEEVREALEKEAKQDPTDDTAASTEDPGDLKDTQEKLKDAETAMEEAQAAYDAAQAAYDEAVEAKQKAESAEKTAKQQLDDAIEEIAGRESELKDAQAAETDARNALEFPAKGSTLEKCNTEVEDAQTKFDKAKDALDEAEQDAKILPRIDALEKSVEGFDARIKELKAEGAVDPDEKGDKTTTTPSKTESGEGETKASKPKTPLENAEAEVETAKSALETAEKKLQTAQQDAADAQKKMAGALANLKKGKNNLYSVQNMINHLSLRENSVKEARIKYAESVGACKTANDKLQSYDAGDKQVHNNIRTSYQEVKKHHDDVILQTKKVEEAEEYRKNGVALETQVSTWWVEIQPTGTQSDGKSGSSTQVVTK